MNEITLQLRKTLRSRNGTNSSKSEDAEVHLVNYFKLTEYRYSLLIFIFNFRRDLTKFTT